MLGPLIVNQLFVCSLRHGCRVNPELLEWPPGSCLGLVEFVFIGNRIGGVMGNRSLGLLTSGVQGGAPPRLYERMIPHKPLLRPTAPVLAE